MKLLDGYSLVVGKETGMAIGKCPFGVYIDDRVRRQYTNALFSEPKHIYCESSECQLWDEEKRDCSIKLAMMSFYDKDA